ncbi:MAG: hypothetical protein H7222_01970 [Methylotenera sp.]|nr:hypothetical protein [Oligoflexia bacterium]
MSATRDKSQNFTFVYSNLHHLYKKGVEAAKAADISHVTDSPAAVVVTRNDDAVQSRAGLQTAKVLKAADLNQGALSTIRISKPLSTELIGKRIQERQNVRTPDEGVKVENQRVPVVKTALHSLVQTVHQPDVVKSQALESLKQNLKNLNDLHARLRFMLKELEELVKE